SVGSGSRLSAAPRSAKPRAAKKTRDLDAPSDNPYTPAHVSGDMRFGFVSGVDLRRLRQGAADNLDQQRSAGRGSDHERSGSRAHADHARFHLVRLVRRGAAEGRVQDAEDARQGDRAAMAVAAL